MRRNDQRQLLVLEVLGGCELGGTGRIGLPGRTWIRGENHHG